MKLPEIEISIKFKGAKKTELKQIKSSKDAYDVFKLLFNADTIEWQEEMVLICLNRANKVIGYYKISKGGMAGTVCDPKIIFTTALNCAASSIIIAHNHPSGNLNPSNEDRKLTEKIKKSGELLDITLLDHLIITDESYYSFADEGNI